MVQQDVKLTSQNQITIPKRIREALHLRGGDRIRFLVTDDGRALLHPLRLVEEDDPSYRLARQIVEAEREIAGGETVPWRTIKRRLKL
ncbi:MAG: hypothetical protein A2Z34_11140 [Planctomycetes bacterium RBG_16_59_8]|nr:MAG: hypothetical protein A2Z34_11140 [Planctomycetes bacterium RBG_16_59_8]